MKEEIQGLVVQSVDKSMDVIDGLEALEKGWVAIRQVDDNLWMLALGRDTSEETQKSIEADMKTLESFKAFQKQWIDYLTHPSMKKCITKNNIKTWIFNAVRLGFVDIAKRLLDKNPDLLTEEYSYRHKDNLYEVVMRCDRVIKEYDLSQQYFYKGRCQAYQTLAEYFQRKGLRLGAEFVKEQQKESLNPVQSVENTIFLSSVLQGMKVLLEDNGYFKPAVVKTFSIYKPFHLLYKQKDKKELTAWVEQLADPHYCKAQAFKLDPIENAAYCAAALTSFRAAIASGDKGARDSSDPRVKSYAGYSAEFNQQKFSMLDIFIVAWQALHRKDRISPEVRDNLLLSWVHAMYEASVAYDDSAINPALPGTREGCSQSMVNPTIALFSGHYPGVECHFLSPGYVANRATALVADYIEKEKLVTDVKQWIRNGGMPKDLYQSTTLDLQGKLEVEYRMFGDKAAPIIPAGLEMLGDREVPDRLKAFVIQQSFNDFFDGQLKNLSLLDKIFMVETMSPHWETQKVKSTAVTMDELWTTNPLLQALQQKIPAFRQDWENHLEKEVFSCFPVVPEEAHVAYKKTQERILQELRKSYQLAALKVLQTSLCDPTLKEKLEKVSMVNKFKRDIERANNISKQVDERLAAGKNNQGPTTT